MEITLFKVQIFIKEANFCTSVWINLNICIHKTYLKSDYWVESKYCIYIRCYNLKSNKTKLHISNQETTVWSNDNVDALVYINITCNIKHYYKCQYFILKEFTINRKTMKLMFNIFETKI